MSKHKRFNQCDAYVTLGILYQMQGLLYPQGIINQFIQLVTILWGLLIFLKFLSGRYRQSKLLKATSALVFMYCIYGGFFLLLGNPFIDHIPDTPMRYIYLQASLRSLLQIFVFYYYARSGLLTASRIRVYAVALLLYLLPLYYYRQAQLIILYDRDEVTNNMGYNFLLIMPLLFFFNKKPLLQYALLAVTLLYLILCMKRGPIAIGVLAFVFIIWSNVFYGKKIKIGTILLTVAILIGVVSVVSTMMLESDYFVSRVEQTLSGDSSGRDVIYGTIWHTILYEQNLFYILFGRGADSTWGIVGNFAHNDWLETLSNNGFIGGIILLYFFICFFIEVRSSRKLFSKNYYFAYLILFGIAFFQTIFSMSIQDMALSTSMLLGYFSYWVYRPINEIVQADLR